MMQFRKVRYLFISLIFLSYASGAFGQTLPERVKNPFPGLEYLLFRVETPDASGNGARIHIVRIDPVRAKLRLLAASEYDRKLRTASEWCQDFNLAVAINAGMFLKDYSTNVGYLKNGKHIQNGRWNNKYRSALAFGPRKEGIAPAIMIDLEDPDAKAKLQDYDAIVQNLRLMKAPGVNVWEKSEKKWAEAAVGMDKEGRVLFIFCQMPLSMWKFNDLVASLGIRIVRLMHVEGGSLAGLSIRAGDLAVDLAGFETGPETGTRNALQMPIPNVIGVQAR
jgi:uncharacterized protein YigE (DUF2233 family)